jgi:hypothetical protein
MNNQLLVGLSAIFLVSISTTAWSAKSKPLDIISPNGGEELVKGKIYMIEWNKSGYGKNLKVKIELLKRNAKRAERVIDAKTKNDGKYEWTIPSDVKFGKKTYRIRIVSVAPSGKRKHGHADKSDRKFSFVKK